MLALIIGPAAILSSVPGYIVEPVRFDIVGTYKQSTLYNIVTANTDAQDFIRMEQLDGAATNMLALIKLR
jgi:hypothetical protein